MDLSKLSKYIKMIDNIHCNKIRGECAPHKHVLLITLIDAISRGMIIDNMVYITPELIALYHAHFQALVKKGYWKENILYPFRYLIRDGFWEIVKDDRVLSASQLGDPTSLNKLMKIIDGGRFTPDWWEFLQDRVNRYILKNHLLKEFFRVGEKDAASKIKRLLDDYEAKRLMEDAHAKLHKNVIKEDRRSIIAFNSASVIKESSQISAPMSEIMLHDQDDNISVMQSDVSYHSVSDGNGKADEHTHEAISNNCQKLGHKDINEGSNNKVIIENRYSSLEYKKVSLGSSGYIPSSSVLRLRLIDSVEMYDISESDLLDRLSKIQISYLQLSDPILADLRSNSVFPDDGLDTLAFYTIGYLIKLSNRETWFDILLRKWNKTIEDSGNRCLDLKKLLSKEHLLLSDFHIPAVLGYMPLCLLGLKKQSIGFLNDAQIMSISDLKKYTEADLFEKSDSIGHFLSLLYDIYSTKLYTKTENWNIIVDYLNQPFYYFLEEYLGNIIADRRNIRIFLLREGLCDNESLTLEEIAGQYKLSRERVRQIVDRIENSIKSARNSEYLDFSPIIRMISNIVYSSGGVLSLDRFAKIICWNMNPDMLSKSLDFILSTSHSDLTLKNNILSVRSQDNINKFLSKLEVYLTEINELKTIEELLNTEPISDIIEEFGIRLSSSSFAEYIKMSDNIDISSDGRIGLKEWKWAFPRTKKDKIYYVLKRERRPMHYTVIHNEINRFFPDDDFENVRATHAALGTHKDIFCLVDRGCYALREWNLEPYVSVGDAIEIVLKQAGMPLSFSDIFGKVSEIGEYSYGNIRLALTRESFSRVGVDQWDLSERSSLHKEWKAKEEPKEDDIHPFTLDLSEKLKNYGYRPFTLDECMNLYSDNEFGVNGHNELLSFIRKCRYLRIHEYGNTYVGLSTWEWFSPDDISPNMTQQANLIEWYFRMTNQPAAASDIAYGILSKIINYRLSAYDVASTCEKNPHRFILDEDGRYILYLWKDAPKYKDNIKKILEFGELDVQHIVSRLSDESSYSNESIIATLHLYGDIFTEVSPFVWKLKETEEFEYSKIDFTSLIPE